MSYIYGPNVFEGALVSSISENGANFDDNALVNNTNYWESGQPPDLSTHVVANSDGNNIASGYEAYRAFDNNTGTSWRSTLKTNAWVAYRFTDNESKLFNALKVKGTGESPRRVKQYLFFGGVSDGSTPFDGTEPVWTQIGSGTWANDGWNWLQANHVNFDKYNCFKYLAVDSYSTSFTLGEAEIECLCATPWIKITPITNRTIRKITIKLHEEDNADGVRVYGENADGEWTLLSIASLANVATAQDIILNSSSAVSYPNYVIIFTGFRASATSVKVDFIGGYEVIETAASERSTGISMGNTNGNLLFDNLLYRAAPTISVTSQASGFEKEFLYDKLQGTVWRSGGISEQIITVQLDSIYNQQGIVLLNHNLDPSLDTVNVEYSNDNFSTIGMNSTLMINPDIAYFISLPPLFYEYTRVRINTIGTVRTYFSIGQLFIPGGVYSFANNYDHGMVWGKDRGKVINKSTAGQPSGFSKYEARIFTAEFNYISEDQRINFEAADSNGGWVLFSPRDNAGPIWFGVVDFSDFIDKHHNQWGCSMVFTESPE